MKKLALLKAAIDAAYAQVGTANAVNVAQASLAAFVAGGFDQADLTFWQNSFTQQLQSFRLVSAQKLVSEQAKPAAPVSEPAKMPAASETTSPNPA